MIYKSQPTGTFPRTNPLIHRFNQILTILSFFFLKDPAPTEIYPLSLPAPLPISNDLAEGEALPDRLAHTKPRLLPDPKQPDAELDESPADDGQDAMVEELNRRVSDALGQIGRAHV